MVFQGTYSSCRLVILTIRVDCSLIIRYLLLLDLLLRLVLYQFARVWPYSVWNFLNCELLLHIAVWNCRIYLWTLLLQSEKSSRIRRWWISFLLGYFDLMSRYDHFGRKYLLLRENFGFIRSDQCRTRRNRRLLRGLARNESHIFQLDSLHHSTPTCLSDGHTLYLLRPDHVDGRSSLVRIKTSFWGRTGSIAVTSSAEL